MRSKLITNTNKIDAINFALSFTIAGQITLTRLTDELHIGKGKLLHDLYKLYSNYQSTVTSMSQVHDELLIG